MTKEDMIRMAKEAGWQYAHGDSGYEPLWEFAELVASAEREKYEAIITNMTKLLEAQQNREGVAVDMIAAGIAAEREACAKLADEWAVGWPHPAKTIALDIRARGQA